ncbi:MAG: signal peptidase I [Candidatus Woesearchaeota archaeon]
MSYKKIVDVITTIILIILIALVVIFAITSVYYRSQDKIIKIYGYSMSYVVSDSMKPTFEAGDVIINKEVKDLSQLEEGDIITYKSEEGALAGKYMTHRIDEIKTTSDNTDIYTKGDNNESIDPEILEFNQIEGVFYTQLEFFGLILSIFLNPLIFFVFLSLPILILTIKNFKKFINTIKT